jgi:hypothetical protein
VSLQGLPSSVTKLHLSSTAATVREELGSSSSSSKPLPALQVLQLGACMTFEHSALAHFSQLQRLSCIGSSEAGTHELLAVLPGLQQLQVLKLQHFDWNVAAAEYAALTSSSHLVSLQLEYCSIPQAALQHMFAPGDGCHICSAWTSV